MTRPEWLKAAKDEVTAVQRPVGPGRSYFFTILIGEESIGPKLFEEARQSHLLFINNFASN